MKINIKWLNIIITIFTVLGVYFTLKYLLPLVLPFALAYIIVTIILPIINFINKKTKLPKPLATGLVLITLISTIGFAIKFLLSIMVKQIKNFIEMIPRYMQYMTEKMDDICCGLDEYFKFDEGYSRNILDGNLNNYTEKLTNSIMPNITGHTIQFITYTFLTIGISIIVFISVILIVKDMGKMKQDIKKSDYFVDIKRIYKKITLAGIAYVRSAAIIMLIISIICIVGLIIIRNPYALIIGIIIAIIDALPILGSGVILVPWSIISIINGEFFNAFILITMYLVSMLTKQFLEPKLIGEKIGIIPLYAIMSMYIGLQLFGVLGFILGPIGLIIVREILDEVLI